MKSTSQIAAAVRTLPSSHPAPDVHAASGSGRACRPAAVERLLRGRAVTGYITD